MLYDTNKLRNFINYINVCKVNKKFNLNFIHIINQ